MKHFKKSFILLICASLLSGCLNLSTKPTETERANIISTNTAMPVATGNQAISPDLPAASPTRELTATPPSLPTLIPGENSSAYQLTKPSPEGLLALMDALNTQYIYFSQQYDDAGNPKFPSMLDELSNIFAIIDSEAKFYYPEGFPNPEIVWKYYPFTSHDGYPAFPSSYLDSLATAVFDDLNRHPDHLKDQGVIDGKGYTVKVYPIELDHDPQLEWLVRMDWEEIVALSWIVLDQNPDGSYTRFTQSLPDSEWLVLSDVTIETLQDFTGDGLTDIISLKQGYAAGTDWYRFYIAKGTKDGFQELGSIDQTIASADSSQEPAYTIGVPSGSKWLTLTVSDPHRINWDCDWNTQTAYWWPYGREQITIMGKEIPETPDCSLARAVSLLDPVDNTTAVQLLENAIGHFDQKNANQRAKLLFAHYRLAILYALLDQDALSRQHLEWLVENSTESEQYLKDTLSSLLKEKKISAIKLCDKMYSGAKMPEEWKEYLGATAAAHAYPGSTEIYPPAICPLREIILDQLHKVDLAQQPIPEKALTDQMIPVALLQTYPFPDQTHPASFMLIREKTPYIAGYVPTRDSWKWEIVEEFDAAEDPPQVFSRDVTGDGFPELAYFQKYRYWHCPDKEQGYKILLTTSIGAGFVSVTHNVCNPVDKTFDPANYLPDENRDGVVDWVADQIRKYAGNSAPTAERTGPATWFTPGEIAALFPKENSNDEKVDAIDELADKLYEGRDVPTIRQKLISERGALDFTDPLVDWKWQRLTYLIAVSYEIEGQTGPAIETFTSILRAKSQTLWGNLAELHLSPK